MRLSISIAVVVGLFSLGSLRAQTPEELFTNGNAAYEQGRYADAVESYRSLLRYDIQDSIVEYNLANAEFRVGNLGQAILHYERARRLDPTDEDIQANLAFARTMCFDRVETAEQAIVVRWTQAVQNRLGPDGQAWIWLAAIWLAVGIVSWCFSRPRGWTAAFGWIFSVVLLVVFVSLASWYVTLDRLEGSRAAVVLDDVVEVLAGPGYNNSALFTVHEGLVLEIRSDRDEWLQVSLPNGLHGWIAKESVVEV